ncbi:UNVERIFIED_CONTAM: hypothetical protein PYX00_006189 [Menopon gallinae]|uniref:Uncharacterized protein n=1 Tax=Menopon gallinae TaxID=328185 RepID=A0AAW2HUB4_9NEOP
MVEMFGCLDVWTTERTKNSRKLSSVVAVDVYRRQASLKADDSLHTISIFLPYLKRCCYSANVLYTA